MSELPPPRRPNCVLWDAIEARQSRREFSPDPIAGEELAALLHAGYGVTHWLESLDGSRSLPFRAVPSGGALYPLELYLAALRVHGFEPGLYHFDPLLIARDRPARAGCQRRRSTLRLSRDRRAVLGAAPHRRRLRAPAVQVRAARLPLRSAGGRSRGQNVLLAAAGLGLAVVPLGGFYDRPTDEFLGLDGVNESTLYTIAIGRAPVATELVRGRILLWATAFIGAAAAVSCVARVSGRACSAVWRSAPVSS